MKQIKTVWYAIILIATLQSYAQPTPPQGKKWEKVEILSDEFEGNSLNTSKWAVNVSTWIGRPPGIFKTNAVKVKDGNLQITNYKLGSAETVNGNRYTHAGGLVRSINSTLYGYYECKMKASRTFMSSTFWLINQRNELSGCNRRVTELDITETVGVNSGGASWINNTIRSMNSNTHSRNVQCNSTPVGQEGGKEGLGGQSWEAYHTYGAWWKNKNEVLFYLDGKFVYKIKPPSDFNLPMYLRLVTETYDWNPVPNGGGMQGSADSRTTYYDWVRTYKLVDDNGTGKNDKVSFKNAPVSIPSKTSYTFNIDYEAKTNREIVVEFWSSTSWLASKQEIVSAGSGTKSITVDLPQAPQPGSGYVYKVHIRPTGTTWRDAINRDQVDNVVVTNPSTQLITNGAYYITSTQSNQRLLSRALEQHSAVMHNPLNYNDQVWMFTHEGNNVYTIKNQGTNRFLEVPNAKCSDGVNVATWTNASGNHKKWKIVSNGTGVYGLQPMHCTNKGLDREKGALNANVTIWGYSKANNNQKWKIISSNNKNLSLENTDDLTFYPNPTENVISIKGLSTNDVVIIYDLMGKIMKKISVNRQQDTIDVSELQSGLYIISIVGKTKMQFIKK